MRLIKLEIRDFRGIEHRIIEANGKSISIYGKNAITKTSTADACFWLLTDKDSQNRSTQLFGIKPRKVLPDGSLGKEVIGKEPMVEGTFELDNGRRRVFKKVYAENWGPNRGAERILKGSKTECWVDGTNDGNLVSKSVTEYNEIIDQIISSKWMKILTNPHYFAGDGKKDLKKKDRRDLLLRLINISDEDVARDNRDLEEYLSLVGGRKKSDVEGALKDRKKEIRPLIGNKDQTGELSIRIDQERKGITEPEQSRADATKSIEALKESLDGKREKLSEVKSGGGVAELNVKVQKIEAEKAEYLNEHREQVDESLKDHREKVAGLESKVDEVDSEYRKAVREYKGAKTDVEDAQEAAKQIADDIQSSSELQPEPKKDDGPETCPYCKQEMPQEDHYEEYLKEFNQKKATKLKELKADLQQAEVDLDELNDVLKAKEQAGAKIKARKEQREQALQKAKAELERMKSEAPEPDTSEFDEQQKALLEKIDELKRSRQSAIDEVSNEITDIEAHIEEVQKVIREHDDNAKKRKEIEKYQAEIKQLGKEMNEIDRKLILIENFTRAKAKMTQDKVNEKFNLVNWRMFKNQKNGALEERCDAVYNSQPWPDLSTSEKIKCGLDIINTLSDHYGKSAPVWADNRESCTQLPENDLQIISLIVSPADESLRIEKGQEILVPEYQSEKELAVA